MYKTAVDTRSLVSPADVTVLQQMQRVLPTGSIVMSDSLDDAGWWMAALTTLTPLVPNASFAAFGTLDTPLDVALSNACTDPAGAEAALRAAQPDAVFIGALNVADPLYPWNVNCIARLPDLRLIASAPYRDRVAAAFAVTK